MRLQRTVPTLPRGFVVEHQKQRVAEALAELCRQRKWGEVTVTKVCKQARMSRTTFYGHFAGVADCGAFTNYDSFRRTCGALLQDSDVTEPAIRLESTLAAWLVDLASQPALAEFCLIHSHSAARDLRECSHELAVGAMQQRIGAFFESGAAPPVRSSGTISEGLARAMLWQVAGRLRRREAKKLPGLETGWMRLIGGYLPTEALDRGRPGPGGDQVPTLPAGL